MLEVRRVERSDHLSAADFAEAVYVQSGHCDFILQAASQYSLKGRQRRPTAATLGIGLGHQR
jgi:hypothetical protein